MHIKDWKAQPKDHPWIEAILIMIVRPVTPFYVGFVIQNLWNWFAVDAFHGSPINYWQAVVAMMVIFLLRGHSVDHNENWSRLFVVLKACVPDKNQASVAEALGKGNDAKRFEIALPSLNRAIHGTVGLGFGWAVHQFLM